MNKIIKILVSSFPLLLLLLAISCSNNDVDPLFDQTINERTDALKTEYLNVLTAPENGWKGYYSPNKNFGAYTMLLNFDENGGVTIKSDYQSNEDDITYRLDKTLKIELVFETSSVFSDIFALNNNNNDGEFVFNVLSATSEEIVLESKLDYGDDVTIFKLYPATAADLDLDNVKMSVENIAGDGTESVFRNVLYNDEVIATFDFNAATRLTTVSYLKDGKIESVSGPIAITADGFYFITPIDVNGIILTSFVYNQTANEYENTSENLRIIYDNIPGVPTNDVDNLGTSGYETFAYRVEWGISLLESSGFIALLESINQSNTSFTIGAWEYNTIPDQDGNIIIYIGMDSVATGARYYGAYSFAQRIENNKLYLTYNGTLNGNAAYFEPLLEPLLGFFKSSEGLYFQNEGSFVTDTSQYSNSASTFTSLENPRLRLYGLWY
ncbi:DUF4302 domain-containing protein [Confluentibacter sediminis]|uniref:DUF4302 domain-containing protein n=1 Tax=Confluentibacter sediminis TaxID=2219045 RepID=UPI000DAF3207|nr:DUF4302 domain-containing protein [Confluentibacter sediminis]